jgi:hypothetical protein
VQVLFDGKFNTSKLSLAKAGKMTNRFSTHFNHAVPFDLDVLEAIWDRCHGRGCAAARREVEGKLKMQAGGTSAFPAMKPGGATQYPATPPESTTATPDTSPETGPN